MAISLTSKLADLSFPRQLILEIESSNFRPKDLKIFHNSLGLPIFLVSFFQSKFFSLYGLVFVLYSLLPYSYRYPHEKEILWIFWKAYSSHLFFPWFQHQTNLAMYLNTFVFTGCKIINNCHDLLNEVFIGFVNVINS